MTTNDLFRLDGKVALITGSTRGIGLAIARMMAGAGARIVISSRKPDACAATLAQFQRDGFAAIAQPAHIGKADDRQRLVEVALDTYGRIDVLVANAAVNPVFAPMQDVPLDVWHKVLETNLTAPWHLSQLVLPQMAHNGGGAMVMLSSVASLMALPQSGPYVISKAAGNHLTQQLAAEWGPRNIRVNAVVPGTTRTDMIRAIFADQQAVDAEIRKTALLRIGDAEDVAAAVLFLASPAARQITGQLLVVDGGQMLFGGAQTR